MDSFGHVRGSHESGGSTESLGSEQRDFLKMATANILVSPFQVDVQYHYEYNYLIRGRSWFSIKIIII